MNEIRECFSAYSELLCCLSYGKPQRFNHIFQENFPRVCRFSSYHCLLLFVYLSAEQRDQGGYIWLVDHKDKDNHQRRDARQPYPPAQLEEPEKLFRQSGVAGVEVGHEPFHLVLSGDITCYPDKTGEQEENKAQ